jgi:hypothetical protein
VSPGGSSTVQERGHSRNPRCERWSTRAVTLSHAQGSADPTQLRAPPQELLTQEDNGSQSYRGHLLQLSWVVLLSTCARPILWGRSNKGQNGTAMLKQEAAICRRLGGSTSLPLLVVGAECTRPTGRLRPCNPHTFHHHKHL